MPVRRLLPVMASYACFGLGYFVYLTFLSAWMTEQQAGAAQRRHDRVVSLVGVSPPLVRQFVCIARHNHPLR